MNNQIIKSILISILSIFGLTSTLNAQSFKWAKSISGPGNEQAFSITTDKFGNVYTTGTFQGTADFNPNAGIVNLTASGGKDVFISKVDSLGNYIWSKSIGGAGDDVGISICIDSSDNVIVTGRFSGTADFDPNAGVVNLTSAGQLDIFIIKLSPDGNLIWAKKIGSIEEDLSTSITVDLNNNIYVTGCFKGTVDFDPNGGTLNLTSGGLMDMFIVKLSSTGIFLWAKSMGSSENDCGQSITTDASGNLYLTGWFDGTVDFDPNAGVVNLVSQGTTDVVITKLDSDGNLIWAKSIGSSGYEFGYKIEIDESNNVYVAGGFENTVDFDPNGGVFELLCNGSTDVFILKLNSSGNFIWAKSFGSLDYDNAFSLALDASKNVYITGVFRGTVDFDPNSGVSNITSQASSSLFISKLDSLGNYVWAGSIDGSQSINNASDIVADNFGYIYLAGDFSQGPSDFDPNGGEFLLYPYNSFSQDVFICKLSQTSCATPNPPSNILGNNNVSSGASETYSVTNDPTATSYIWTLPSGWSGTSTTNSINVTTGSTGGVISVAAQNSCGNSSPSILTISTTIPSGSENHEWTWAKSSGNTFAAQYAMNTVTDTEDNAYVTGHFNSSTLIFGGITLNKVGSGTSIYIAKYNSDGSVAWAKTAGGSNQNSESWDIDIDASNNVYIMGTFSSPTITFESTTLTHTGNGSDIFIAKYDSNGNLIWAKEIDYTSTLFLYDIDVDLNGNIFIGGSFSIDPITIGSTTLLSNANTHPFIAKFDTNGNALWAKAPQNSTSYANWGTAITSDIYGNVYFTGQYNASSSDPFIIDGISLPYTNFKKHIFLVKYDPSGNFSWVKTFGGTTNISSSDYPHGLTCDSQGNLIMIGAMRSESLSFDAITITNSNNNNINPEIFLVKFDESGNSLWAKTAGGLASDAGHRIATDEFDNLYISGYFESKPASFGSITITKEDNGSPIIYVAKYDENGVEKWVKHVENTTGKYGDLPANGIAVSNIGSIYVVGTAYYNAVFGSTTLSQGGIFIAKMGPSIVAVKELNDGGNKLQIYPNPSNGIIYLRALNAQWDSEIEIYNLQGQLIFESNHFESEIDLSNQPKGMYTVKLKSDNDVFVEKIILK
jgi:hypothetical protein